jgi:energy-converting hydrogenase Eha subunit E
MALSFGEDVVAISLTWLATQHPVAASVVVLVAVALTVVMIRFVIRALRKLFQRARAEI